MFRRVFIAAAALVLALPAVAGELAGVTMAERVSVDGTALVLNGMGLRKKAIFKVYVGGLYLPEKSSDADAVIALDAPKRMVMHFVRSVDKGKITEAWREGMTGAAQADVDAFLGWWPDMDEGDRAVMTYVPGTGTTVEIKGRTAGVIPGKPFADALFAVWLGAKPPSEDFKSGLLGQ